MNRQTIIITVLLLTAILIGSFVIFTIINTQQQEVSEEKSFFDTIFLFGGTPNVTRIPETTPPQAPVIEETGVAPALRHVSSFPIAGVVVFQKDEAEIIRYAEKGSSHIYETKTTLLGQEKISNTTIPKIFNALWLPDNSSLILQYINERGKVENFYAELSENSLDGSFLRSGAEQIAVVDNTIRYIVQTDSGSRLMTARPDGTRERQLYSSAFKDWSVSWWSPTLAILTTKPSYNTPGFSFFLNTNSGRLTKILDSILGLTILANTKTGDVLVSATARGDLSLRVYNTETETFKDAGITTLPEKCVWAEKDTAYCAVPKIIENASYPDDWYKGLVSFSDDIWIINVETETTELVSELEEIDGINLTLSPSKEYLLFTNKKDSTLWSLRLKK